MAQTGPKGIFPIESSGKRSSYKTMNNVLCVTNAANWLELNWIIYPFFFNHGPYAVHVAKTGSQKYQYECMSLYVYSSIINASVSSISTFGSCYSIYCIFQPAAVKWFYTCLELPSCLMNYCCVKAIFNLLYYYLLISFTVSYCIFFPVLNMQK